MHVLLWKELLLLLKKTFVTNDFMNLAENRRAPAAITSNTANDATIAEKLAFKNIAPFVNCISKNGVLTDNPDELDVVMPMYNLLEYSKNNRKTTGSLWNYYKDETNSAAEGNIAALEIHLGNRQLLRDLPRQTAFQ